MMKRKRNRILAVLFLAAVGMVFVFANIQKKTEIVWYLSDPEYFGIDREDMQPYQEVYAKRFDLFNKRLGKLGIAAKVVFKYLPDSYEAAAEEEEGGFRLEQELICSGEAIQTLLQNDLDADIAQFSSMEYDRFLPLDSYMESEGMQRAQAAIPQEIWDVNRINGTTYQIPRGNVCVKEAAYCFQKSFLDQYRVDLDEEKIKKMTPEEVIQWLLPYFEEERLLEGGYYLTNAAYLDFSDYLLGEYMPVLEGTTNNLYVHMREKKIADGFSMQRIKDAFALYQYIYENNLDAHDSPGSLSARPVFTIQNMPGLKQLQGSYDDAEDIVSVPLGNPFLTRSLGNGVFSGSKHKELAMQVLAASVYDEELSNLMIYGVPEEDYVLSNGYAVGKQQGTLSYMGTFGAIGNNFIAYPNERETPDKEERSRNLFREMQPDLYRNFVPDWDEELLKQMSRLAAVYQEAVRTLQSSEVPDLEAFLTMQQEKLEEAGRDDVMRKLQEQLDGWEE